MLPTVLNVLEMPHWQAALKLLLDFSLEPQRLLVAPLVAELVQVLPQLLALQLMMDFGWLPEY